MPLEKKKKIAKVLSLVVIIAGMAVIIGWIFDISILKSLSPSWISMKFDTAVAFVLSGIILYFIIRTIEGEFDKSQVVLLLTSLIIIFVMGILFFSAFLGINTGVENLFVKELTGGVKTVIPGRPSMPTMINFILIASAGILTTLNLQKLPLNLKIIGLVVGAIGAVALAGYIINAPTLYYYVEGINSAMACHTAVLFMILGTGLLCL